jgi:hypothetical protein
MVSSFLPGLELCRRFYEEAVRPLLEHHFSDLVSAAALLGNGSDVLGFDTEMSMDHDWGPRLLLFLREQDRPLMARIDQMLCSHLPHDFLNFPVGIREMVDDPRIATMHRATGELVKHRVVLLTLRDLLQSFLAYDLDQPLEVADWLTFPAQKLLALTAGAIYYDGIGELAALRERLTWYPRDVWLYLLACGWQRIGQEEHLMPRAGFVGDELGAALIGSRLVRDCMNLCFLLEKKYAPYPKWFGSAFQRLVCAEELGPHLWRAQQAPTWQERENALGQVYAVLTRMQNALCLTPRLPESSSHFYERPFQVIHGERFAQALLTQIVDPTVQRLAKRRLIGSIDQFSDNTDLLAPGSWRPLLRRLYE